jgi:S-adenosylmethionine:tRNA ribosyltransferase-isomerase
MLKTSDFDFDLPPELIAQAPFFPREETKMLVFNGASILDSQVIFLNNFLQEGDVLVFNDAKVIKAKLSAKILRNQAKLDFNLDQEINGIWQALCRPSKKVNIGDELEISADFFAEVLEKSDDGFIKIKFDCEENELLSKLEKYGAIPLPPYIKRTEKNQSDQINYQTIYAANGLAVAAPTSGLHFTDKIFALLEAKKIQKVFITLNVGAGTFLPVRADEIKDHKMHEEFFSISKEAAETINRAKKNGKRIVAVGTTSLRALESAASENTNKNCYLEPTKTRTKIFIYPGYKFKIVDILMTNFHLPKSTLFMLICAFVGKEKAFEIYKHAVVQKYRFYSYGDSSLLFLNKICK